MLLISDPPYRALKRTQRWLMGIHLTEHRSGGSSSPTAEPGLAVRGEGGAEERYWLQVIVLFGFISKELY